MSQGPPYGSSDGFTPYEPDPTPDAEPRAGGPTDSGAAAPYVPYGQETGTPQVPYAGGAAQFYAPVAKTTRSRALPWVIGIVVLVATCGGGIAALVAAIAGADITTSTNSQEGDDVVFTNDLQEDQCLIGAGLEPRSEDSVSNLEVVGCSTAHDAEVIAVKVLNADEAAAYDFENDNAAVDTCRDLFSPAEMKLLNRSDLYLIALTESAEPVTGDKVACLLVRDDGGTLHGSLNDPTAEPPAQSEVEPT